MKKIIPSLLILLSMSLFGTKAQTPELYREVDHLIWVVEDIDAVIQSWEQLGFSGIEPAGKIEIICNNNKSVALATFAQLNGARVIWIQPLRGSDPFRTFLRLRGEGVMALIHSTITQEKLDAEVSRLSQSKIANAETITFLIDNRKITYHFMDTGELGRYIVGLTTKDGTSSIFKNDKMPENKYGLKFSQFAFATDNPKAVSDFWVRYGFPEMEITHSEISDPKYYGREGNFKMDLGWQRHGKIVYEWCIPLKGENVYTDHIKVKGEGVHHLGFEVPEMDPTLSAFEENGFIVSQSGGWGEKGKAGSGRFAYLDPQNLGGIAVELLWNYKE